jgi:transcription termination factor Rho
MNSVLDRDALEGSPLADLHLIADQLGVDGYRRLRKAELVDAIVERQGGGEDKPARRRRGGRTRAADPETSAAVEAADKADEEEAEEPRPARRQRRPAVKAVPTDATVEGVVELQGNGSGFVRAEEGEDVYISAAQVKRCELVSGDRVGGPVRPPRRSERFPSLVRVDTINGKPAEEVAGKEGTRFDELPATFPTERVELGSDDPTVTAVEWLTPFGKGSRVVVAGGPLAGKSELLRRIAGALAGRDGLELTVVLAGARPEEVTEWGEVAQAAPLGASGDAQGNAVEQAVEQGRRVAARGGDAVVIIDALDHVSPQVARRALAAARNIVDGGSLTVLAAAPAPFGGETTVITLDASLTALRRFPNVDLAASGTMRPELLVGDGGAEKIAEARAEAAAAQRGA